MPETARENTELVESEKKDTASGARLQVSAQITIGETPKNRQAWDMMENNNRKDFNYG